MIPAIIHSIHIDKTNPFVITSELISQCKEKCLHIVFGATNLDMEKADAYILSSSGFQVVPISIRKKRQNQVVIRNVDDIPKVVSRICKRFNVDDYYR